MGETHLLNGEGAGCSVVSKKSNNQQVKQIYEMLKELGVLWSKRAVRDE